MNLRNLFGLLLLVFGCAGIVGFCLGSTDTIRIAGPMNFSYFDDVWYVGIGILPLGLMIWAAMRVLNQWATAAGVICLTTGVGVFLLMILRLGNLSEEVLSATDGRYGPANSGTYAACALPAAILLAVGYWKAAHCQSK